MAKRLLALAATLVLVGCGETPTQTVQDDLATPAFARIGGGGPGWFDQDITINNPCVPELVDYTTRRKEVVTVTEDGSGGLHVGYHRTWIGTGVGQETGDTYSFSFPWQEQFTAGGPFPQTFTRTVQNNRISRGPGDNLVINWTFHYTINANGELTTDFVKVDPKCVG